MRSKNDKRTVLHVVSTLQNGGTERYLINLLKGTSDRYNNIVFYYYGDNSWGADFKKLGVPAYKASKNKKNKNYYRMRDIKKLINEHHIDTIYAYTYYNSAYIMLQAFLCGVKKRITHAHRSNYEAKVNKLKVFLSKVILAFFATDRLACSKDAGKSLFLNRFTIVDNGIDLNRYKFCQETRKKIRNKLNIKDDQTLLSIIGRLDDNKNQAFALKVFNEFKKMHPNSKLLIIGKGNNKSLLKKIVKKYDLIDDVVFIDNVDNMNEYYSALDLLMLTSKKEGLPFVLIEAQANGLPTVVSDSIDKSAKINSNFKFLSLKDRLDEWSNAIGDMQKNRVVPDKKIDQYSVEEMARTVRGIYEK